MEQKVLCTKPTVVVPNLSSSPILNEFNASPHATRVNSSGCSPTHWILNTYATQLVLVQKRSSCTNFARLDCHKRWNVRAKDRTRESDRRNTIWSEPWLTASGCEVPFVGLRDCNHDNYALLGNILLRSTHRKGLT